MAKADFSREWWVSAKPIIPGRSLVAEYLNPPIHFLQLSIQITLSSASFEMQRLHRRRDFPGVESCFEQGLGDHCFPFQGSLAGYAWRASPAPGFGERPETTLVMASQVAPLLDLPVALPVLPPLGSSSPGLAD